MIRNTFITLVLTAAAVATHAQSSVEIYGFVDAAIGKNIGASNRGVIDSAGSRLGFRGSEDLGGGLKAIFELETRFDSSTGQTSTPFWKGRSYVGLESTYGTVKLGRWWSQAYLYGQYQADPFANQTIAANYGAVGCGKTGCVGAFWYDKSVTYNAGFGGFSFGAQVAEAPLGLPDRPVNAGVSYTAGGLWLGYGYENPGNTKDVWHQATVTYEIGGAKVSAGYGQGRNASDQKVRNAVVGGSVALGSGRVIASYEQHKVAAVTEVSRAALGYQHPLSKRTKVYATVARDSKTASSKSGYDLGLLHSF